MDITLYPSQNYISELYKYLDSEWMSLGYSWMNGWLYDSQANGKSTLQKIGCYFYNLWIIATQKDAFGGSQTQSIEHCDRSRFYLIMTHSCVCVCQNLFLFLYNIYTYYEFIKYWFRFKFNKPIKHVKDIENILFGVFIKYLLIGISKFNDLQRTGM